MADYGITTIYYANYVRRYFRYSFVRACTPAFVCYIVITVTVSLSNFRPTRCPANLQKVIFSDLKLLVNRSALGAVEAHKFVWYQGL